MVFIENKAALLCLIICGVLFKSIFLWEQGIATGSYKIEIILLFESFIQSFIANIGVLKYVA